MAREHVNFMDVSPKQVVSVAAALILFLEHDDANRASRAEHAAASSTTLAAETTGWYRSRASSRKRLRVCVTARRGALSKPTTPRNVVRVNKNETESGKRGLISMTSLNMTRSNQNTCINQRLLVREGDTIAKNDVLADGPSVDTGELALGQNMRIAFMT